MKKLIFLLLSLFLINQAMSQRFLGSVIAGMNTTQVSGDEVYGFRKFGVNAGAAVMIALEDKQRWYGTVELLFSQKGSYQKSQVNTICDSCPPGISPDAPCDPAIKYKLNLNYVEVPVVFHYESPKTNWAIGLGVAWGRLVNIKEIQNGRQTTTSLQSGTYSKNEWSALADVKIKLFKGLKLNFRYQYTFVPIRKRSFRDGVLEWDRYQYNNVITLRLIYVFNEKWKRNEKGRWVKDIISFKNKQ